MVLHLADRDELELPFRKLTLFRDLESALAAYRQALELARDRVSKDYLVALMQEFEGNVTRAATRASRAKPSNTGNDSSTAESVPAPCATAWPL